MLQQRHSCLVKRPMTSNTMVNIQALSQREFGFGGVTMLQQKPVYNEKEVYSLNRDSGNYQSLQNVKVSNDYPPFGSRTETRFKK